MQNNGRRGPVLQTETKRREKNLNQLFFYVAVSAQQYITPTEWAELSEPNSAVIEVVGHWAKLAFQITYLAVLQLAVDYGRAPRRQWCDSLSNKFKQFTVDTCANFIVSGPPS